MTELEREESSGDLVRSSSNTSVGGKTKSSPLKKVDSKRRLSGFFGSRSNVLVAEDDDKPNILMEGYLLKQTGVLKGWKQRKVRLLLQQLVYFNEANPKSQMNCIPLDGCTVEEAYPAVKECVESDYIAY